MRLKNGHHRLGKIGDGVRLKISESNGKAILIGDQEVLQTNRKGEIADPGSMVATIKLLLDFGYSIDVESDFFNGLIDSYHTTEELEQIIFPPDAITTNQASEALKVAEVEPQGIAARTEVNIVDRIWPEPTT